MDEILELFFRGFIRGIGYLVGELLFKFVFYGTGAIVWRILTFGKFPATLDGDPFDSLSSMFYTFFGAIIYISLAVFLIKQYG